MKLPKNQRGFIDPASLVVVGFLLLTLATTTILSLSNQNPFEKAAGGCTKNPAQCSASEECINGVCKKKAGATSGGGGNQVESATGNTKASCDTNGGFWCAGCGGFCITGKTQTCNQAQQIKCGEVPTASSPVCNSSTKDRVVVNGAAGNDYYVRCDGTKWVGIGDKACIDCMTELEASDVPTYLVADYQEAKQKQEEEAAKKALEEEQNKTVSLDNVSEGTGGNLFEGNVSFDEETNTVIITGPTPSDLTFTQSNQDSLFTGDVSKSLQKEIDLEVIQNSIIKTPTPTPLPTEVPTERFRGSNLKTSTPVPVPAPIETTNPLEKLTSKTWQGISKFLGIGGKVLDTDQDTNTLLTESENEIDDPNRFRGLNIKTPTPVPLLMTNSRGVQIEVRQPIPTITNPQIERGNYARQTIGKAMSGISNLLKSGGKLTNNLDKPLKEDGRICFSNEECSSGNCVGSLGGKRCLGQGQTTLNQVGGGLESRISSPSIQNPLGMVGSLFFSNIVPLVEVISESYISSTPPPFPDPFPSTTPEPVQESSEFKPLNQRSYDLNYDQYGDQIFIQGCPDRNLTMANIGCGPTTISNILGKHSEIITSPLDVALDMKSQGLLDCGGTSRWDTVKYLEQYDYTSEKVSYPPINVYFNAPEDQIFWVSGNFYPGGSSEVLEHHAYFDGYSMEILPGYLYPQPVFNLVDPYFGEMKCTVKEEKYFDCISISKNTLVIGGGIDESGIASVPDIIALNPPNNEVTLDDIISGFPKPVKL